MADAPSNWIDFLISLSPVAQTGIWAGAIVAGVLMLKKPIHNFADRLIDRVRQGDDFTTPWLSVARRKELEKLEKAEVPADPTQIPEESLTDIVDLPQSERQWSAFRGYIYKSNRDIFLVHVISPSSKLNQLYDIFIYLKRHKSNNLNDVASAEFFFGQHWGNKIFYEKSKDGLIGVQTSAHGPFLCVCKIKFTDGGVAMLHRYIDFEMGIV